MGQELDLDYQAYCGTTWRQKEEQDKVDKSTVVNGDSIRR